MRSNVELFFPQDHFAVADRLVIHPQTILVGAGVRARAWRTALKLAALRGLKHIGLERAPVGIELDFEIRGVGKPNHLLGRADYDNFGDHAYEYQFLRHRFAPLRRTVKIAQQAPIYMPDRIITDMTTAILAVARK